MCLFQKTIFPCQPSNRERCSNWSLTLCFSINLGGYFDYPPSLCLLFSPQVLRGHHLFETFAMLQLPRILEQCVAAHGKHRNPVVTSLPSAPIILPSHPLLAPAVSSTAFHPLKPPIMLVPLPCSELSALPCCPSKTSLLPGAGPVNARGHELK